ncbi:dTDP-4-dehydrorhamnose 3,5-epimerase [Alteromonas sp. W364]|uniref:dTDP-4-dehydrorhamnose 3,5-epimerase n=1 Tax=Alteromonas sp. W364 TaxID=3075610 RepID=UPI002886D681|nr:dTDP-4-dehydrorhamnose 3,5-epimerase [Alteromonas sp. W364]MDT0627735.1 dTDP-4-dehydrorhamnose 3,5-epimerase [Alteromonas sp. W364]
MKIVETGLSGLYVLTPKIFKDSRGEFHEFFRETFNSEIGVAGGFVQENVSKSSKGVLRGLHYQVRKPQGKLVSCLSGEVWDVAVDLRPSSATFGQHFGISLNSETRQQLYIPEGFAHAFYTVSETALIHYKCTSYYDASDEGGVIYNDKELNIQWPDGETLLSDKDSALPPLSEAKLVLGDVWGDL